MPLILQFIPKSVNLLRIVYKNSNHLTVLHKIVKTY